MYKSDTRTQVATHCTSSTTTSSQRVCDCCQKTELIREGCPPPKYVKYQGLDWLVMKTTCNVCRASICCECMNFCHTCQEESRSGEVICTTCNAIHDYHISNDCFFHNYQLCSTHHQLHNIAHPGECVECLLIKTIFS